MWAAEKGHTDIVRYLVDHAGANINCFSSVSDCTRLFICVGTKLSL